MKNFIAFTTAVLIFAGCIYAGSVVSWHKPIWNDEYYTQEFNTSSRSYQELISGKFSEGANTPLFYILQKFYLQLIGYQTPEYWMKGIWYDDDYSRRKLRNTSIFFMSLSVGIVVFYFAQKYSWWAGIISFLIYITSFMFLNYLVEARPYSLLVLLTSIQSIIFLEIMDKNSKDQRCWLWGWLAVTNILLGFTSVFSLGVIWGVSVLLWIFKERDWRKYIFMTLLPSMIILYYHQVDLYKDQVYHFDALGPLALILDNISRQRFSVLFLFLILLAIYGLRGKIKPFKVEISEEILKPVPYVIFTALVLAFSAGVIFLISLHAAKIDGSPVASRFFIYLTPIGVIATTMLLISFFTSLSKYRIMKWALVILMLFLVIRVYFP